MATTDTPQLGSVLVIDGCDFLEQHIVQTLLSTKSTSKIIVLDTTTIGNFIHRVECVTGSISSQSMISKVLQDHKPHVIFHTASPNPLRENRKLLYEANVRGTEVLLECIESEDESESEFATKALIYNSSSSVVHNSYTDLINVTEDLPLFHSPEQ